MTDTDRAIARLRAGVSPAVLAAVIIALGLSQRRGEVDAGRPWTGTD